MRLVVAVYINETSKDPSSVIVMAGFRAANWEVPDNSPTALVSIKDSSGPKSQMPMAGMANWIIFRTVGALNFESELFSADMVLDT
jgi:hypothetical protein